MAQAEAAVVTLTGPGAVTAAQGLLTNDVDKPGDGAFVYGALLTPKGMIVVDAWVARLGATMSFAIAAQGRERALAIFTRSVPPRLARLADRTAELAVYRLAGPNALAVAGAAGLPVPSAPGRVVAAPGGTSEIARATEGAPFTLQLTLPMAETEVQSARLAAAGAVPVDAATLELARILAGWPRLGAEVDDKTIPQEVRYDELGGVSYTKGCYTGQETVSRLHFRGHTNRYLRGLLFDAEPPATPAAGWSAHAPRPRCRSRHQPRLGARERRRRRGALGRPCLDPSRGGSGGDGPRRGARRAGRRPPLRPAVRRPRMTVLVPGGSGLIGSPLIQAPTPPRRP